MQRQRTRWAVAAGVLALGAALLLALGLAGALDGLNAVQGAAPRARESIAIVRRLLPERAWEVVEETAHAAKMHRLWPARDASVDGGRRYALRMPPPCAVRFVVRLEDGSVRLRAAAGVDHRIPDSARGGRVRFAVEVNGAQVFDAQVDLRPDASPEERARSAAAPGRRSPPTLPRCRCWRRSATWAARGARPTTRSSMFFGARPPRGSARSLPYVHAPPCSFPPSGEPSCPYFLVAATSCAGRSPC